MKEVLSFVAGAVAGGAGVYFYLYSKLKQLEAGLSAGVAAAKKAGL